MSLRELKETLDWTGDQGAEDVILVNNTTKDYRVTVPQGEEWDVLGGLIHNADDVGRNCSVQAFAQGGTELATFELYGLRGAGSYWSFPRNNQIAKETPRYPVRMKVGDYVRFYWAAGGASTGGTAKIKLIKKIFKKG